MRQQPYASMKVVVRIGSNRPLQVGHGGVKVAQFNFGDTSAVKRIHRIRPLRNRAVITRASPREIPVVQIKQPQLFIISRRRIISDRPLQLVNPSSSWKGLKRSTQQLRIRNHFRNDVNQRSDPSQKYDDE